MIQCCQNDEWPKDIENQIHPQNIYTEVHWVGS